MRAFNRKRLLLPVVSLVAAFSLSAQAQEQNGPGGRPGPQGRPVPSARPTAPGPAAGHAIGPGQVHAVGPGQVARPTGPVAGRGPDARYARGAIVARDFGGHGYRGRVGWEGGRWRHEIHNGRDGWWWDVGGVWYYYPERLDGPPTYVSEDYADDVVYAPAGAYAPPPPPVAYEPAPPPPPADPGASALGGAIVGGVLGGLLTGRASGAAAGAVVGGATGALVGATAAARPGYYLSQGNCYYRYPSGEYVAVDPRSCY